jgi:hypothetical protein
MTSDYALLSKDDLKEILNKNWMTHDAMWFYLCLQEFGIEKTNKINKAAVCNMAAIEIKRIHKALGAVPLDTFDKFQNFFNTVMEIVTGKFMKYRYSMPEKNLVHAQWDECFAHEGMKKLGISDRYECGIMLRIDTWLKTLGIKFEVEPKVTGCMMDKEGKCLFKYRFFFD